MDTIRRVLKSTQQTDQPRMLVRVVTVEKMLKDYDELRAMMTAFRHAANSIGVEAGITKDHVGHGEIAESVCGDAYYLELISEAEERFKRQAVENDQLKAQVNRMRDTLHTFGMEHWLNPNVSILPPEIAAVLNETPAQSLAEHDAALLEGFGNKMLAVNNDDNLIGTAATYEYYQSVAEDAFQEAADIRQEALSDG